MAYRVELSPQAEQEIDAAYSWLAEASPAGARRWYNGLVNVLRSLGEHPQRCPLATEDHAFREQIRQVLYGRRRNRYRVLFTISGRTVQVLHVRHGARRYVSGEQNEVD